jgi:methylase of polypeptide subunit release factors
MVRRTEALGELLRSLKAAKYHFIAVTPATHAQVLARRLVGKPSLRDIFGWNRRFGPGDLSSVQLDLLEAADALDDADGRLRSRVRVATLGPDLILHGAFPTIGVDSVFLGPDTYRFARFIEFQLPRTPEDGWLVDMGAGSGAGTIAALRLRQFAKATMVDVNNAALKLAAINAAVAGVRADTLAATAMPAGADLVIANPPYMMDAEARSYRDGGNLLGGAIAIDWARQALTKLAPGGTMLLYTGVAYADGRSPALDELAIACADASAALEISEIDPDVFGDELSKPQYQGVERIAAIGAVISTGAA